jgi:hypothetical protein
LILVKKKTKRRNTKTAYKKENKPKTRGENIFLNTFKKKPNSSSCNIKSTSSTFHHSIAP